MNSGGSIILLGELSTLVPIGISLLIPFLTEKALGATTSPQLRSVVNLLAAALVAAVGTVVFSGDYADIGDYLMNIFLAWLATARIYITEWVKGGRNPVHTPNP
jgi:hypothetical protein